MASLLLGAVAVLLALPALLVCVTPSVLSAPGVRVLSIGSRALGAAPIG